MTAHDRSTVDHELALWPGCSARARIPPTARPAPRGERRRLLVLTAGPVPHLYGRYLPARWTRPHLLNARGSCPLPLRADPTEGREGLRSMTRTEHNLAARRRGELTRDRGSRRISPAIDAQRRLNARQADGTPTNAAPFGPKDRRYAYLTRSYEGLARRLAKRDAGSVEGDENEVELYRKIIRRAKSVRERAAESLTRSRRLRHGQRKLG